MQKGHLNVCKLIIDNTKDKNPKSINGQTPLHLAARYGHVEICQLIIERIENVAKMDLPTKNKKIEKDLKSNPPNKDGWTPFHMAAEFGHFSVCKFMLQILEDKNPKNKV